MHGVRHVNALAPDQRLTLHRVGLTIIYGDNGSGKSGYARILKKVCRARTSTFDLYVYCGQVSESPLFGSAKFGRPSAPAIVPYMSGWPAGC